MASLGTLTLGTYTNVSSTAIQGSDPVLEAIGSTDDTDYVYDETNSTHTGTASFALGDTPADFGAIATVSINLRYARASGSQVNTWNSLQARIFKSDGTTALTALTTIASTITTTTLTNSGAIAMGSPDTAATKADWDGAVVHLYWNITKVKSGDTLRKNVYAAEVTGTYDLAPVNASIAATQDTDAAAITAANWTTAQVSATQATDVAALTTTVTTGATVAATQATDAAAITAANWTTAQIAATQDTDAASVTAANWTTAQVAATEESNTASITASVSFTTEASIAATQDSDSASITAENITTAQIVAVQDSDAAAIEATASGEPVAPPAVGGGGGGWGYAPSSLRRKRIDQTINEWVEELYQDLTAKEVPKEVKKEVKAVVKPFKTGRSIDIAKLARDAERVSALIALWERTAQENDDEEAAILGMLL